MNPTLLNNETPAQLSDESTLVQAKAALSELYAVELAYVGGGMANVAFM